MVRQEANKYECRNRMENLDYAAKFYQRKINSHTDDFGKMLEFARQESIVVNPAGFRLERLTREYSGVDSFLINYNDPYANFTHYEDMIEFHFPAGKDSLVLTINPRPEFAYIPPSVCTIASDTPINVRHDRRGDQGWFVLVGTQGALRIKQLIPEAFPYVASEYIFNNFDGKTYSCPASGEDYHAIMNVRLSINADLNIKYETDPVDSNLRGSSHLSSTLIYRFLREADAFATRDITGQRIIEMIEDSLLRIENADFLEKMSAKLEKEGKDLLAEAIYDSIRHRESFPDEALYIQWEVMRDSLYNHLNTTKASSDFIQQVENLANAIKVVYAEAYFEEGMSRIRRSKVYNYSESGEISTIADSVGYFSDPEIIRNRLLPERTDAMTVSYLKREDVKDFLSHLSFEELYNVSKVDTTRISIKCPIEGEYVKKNRSFLERIFPVRGDVNHGEIIGGKASWGERN